MYEERGEREEFQENMIKRRLNVKKRILEEVKKK